MALASSINQTSPQKSNILVPDFSGIPILSFFTGAGFLDIGFLQAGFNTIWSNEYDPMFIKGFEFGMSSLTNSDYRLHNNSSIIDVGPNEIAREAFGSSQIPSIFGVIGGPPCPDFSVGGKNRGREGDRGKLSQVYVNRIIELQPTFFLFENVPGLLRTSKHRLFFNNLIEQLSKDYMTDFKILNALEFGVPQDRERVFFIGIHKKWLRKNASIDLLSKEHWFPWPSDARYTAAKTRFNWITQTPFGSSIPKPENIPEELMVGNVIGNHDEISKLPNGLEGFRPRSDKFLTILEGDVSRKSFKRLHRWRYSPTAAYGNNEVHLHPIFPRRITVREAMRIQTVPDHYILPGSMSLTAKFKTIGNGVPVKLAYTIASVLKKIMKGETKL